MERLLDFGLESACLAGGGGMLVFGLPTVRRDPME
jgi:hypothetical protein